ncbi:MAG TPA: beta-propeller domain-containing protein [Candidatus Anaerotruncus excrementipullorum]|uniref:Beta-propeller domain-containing protein n=1 Tax=Candidatus Anaerotruncus excrementipullorum TaxID=2838465 RepID=A0A9D2B6I1_9FIRM|nr:beta-propeller domain-containing protein [Candidatus Anaerotruncus excrementipullorum]
MDSEKRQELEESLAFLRGRFEELNQDIKRPHSLDAEVLRKKLEELEAAPPVRPALRFPKQWRAAAGIAACFVFVVGAFLLAGPQSSENLLGGAAPAAGASAAAAATEGTAALEPEEGAAGEETVTVEEAMVAEAAAADDALPKENPQTAGGVPRMALYGASQTAYAESYAQLRDQVYALGLEAVDGVSPSISLEAGANDMDAGRIEDQAGAEAAPKAAAATENTPHRRQEGGELLQTDGGYLYSYVMKNTTSTGPSIRVLTLEGMEEVASIPLESDIETFYVYEGRLAAVALDYAGIPASALPKTSVEEAAPEPAQVLQGNWCGVGSDTAAKVTFYDLSDPTQPRLEKSFQQSGGYRTSQLKGGTLYLLSEWGVSQDPTAQGAALAELVPATYDSTQPAAQLLEAEQILLPPDAASASYGVLSAIDLATGQAQTQAVLGGAEGFCLTADGLSLYVDGGGWTSLLQLETGSGGFSLAGSTTLSGRLVQMGGLPGADGCLYAAVSSPTGEGAYSSSLYLMDGQLQTVGVLDGLLAEGELSAACAAGQTAALCANTAEGSLLVAVDLQDTAQPQVGEPLELPIFLRQLIPLREGLVLGVGQSPDRPEADGGLELVVVELSGSASPRLASRYPFGARSHSDALTNPSAVLVQPQERLFGLPVLTRTNAVEKERAYMLFTWEDAGSLKLVGSLTQGMLSNTDYSAPQRAVLAEGEAYIFAADWLARCQLDPWQVLELRQLF